MSYGAWIYLENHNRFPSPWDDRKQENILNDLFSLMHLFQNISVFPTSSCPSPPATPWALVQGRSSDTPSDKSVVNTQASHFFQSLLEEKHILLPLKGPGATCALACLGEHFYSHIQAALICWKEDRFLNGVLNNPPLWGHLRSQSSICTRWNDLQDRGWKTWRATPRGKSTLE